MGRDFDALVIPTGGVFGKAYIRGLCDLCAAGFRFARAYGASAGAIVALVARATELRPVEPETWPDIVAAVESALAPVKYTIDLADLLVGAGNSIGALKDEVLRLLGVLGLDADARMRDVPGLRVSAYEVFAPEDFCGTGQIVYFSEATFPDVSVVDAITASCCLFIFGTYAIEIGGVRRRFMDAMNIEDYPSAGVVPGSRFAGAAAPFEGVGPGGSDAPSGGALFFSTTNSAESRSDTTIVDTVNIWRTENLATQVADIKQRIRAAPGAADRMFRIELFDKKGISDDLELEKFLGR